MFSSITITPDSLEELPAKSSYPWTWFGFLFAAAFFIEETLAIVLETDESVAYGILILIALAGWIYWLFCIHRFHKILHEISRNQYPITGAEAVGKHFIPFYNLFWIFKWPSAISDYLNRRGRVNMVSGNLLGVLLLLSLLTGRFFDSGVGLSGIFAVGMYISAKLRRHTDLIKGIPSEMLPPLPNEDLFGYAPVRRRDDSSLGVRECVKTRTSWEGGKR